MNSGGPSDIPHQGRFIQRLPVLEVLVELLLLVVEFIELCC
jgi:hypothetical protein